MKVEKNGFVWKKLKAAIKCVTGKPQLKTTLFTSSYSHDLLTFMFGYVVSFVCCNIRNIFKVSPVGDSNNSLLNKSLEIWFRDGPSQNLFYIRLR